VFERIANVPRDYAWGSQTAIAELLGTEPSGGPEAELWLGAHPGSPARLVDRPGTLLDLAPDGLPFLLKVLAASAPLSLQAHPTPEQARAGLDRENAARIPLDAPHRNYKDANHKPELIYALSDQFRALAGFRPVEQTRTLLEPVATDRRIAQLLQRLVNDGSLRVVFEWLITGGDDVSEVVAALVEASAVLDDTPWDTVRLLADHYPGDPGIAISLLLHTVTLRPGEALYLPAGNIHAYLEGLGVELMASSDNVLRGGLTPKHIDVPELLSVLDFRPLPPPYLLPIEVEPGVLVLRPDVPDFELTVVTDAALRRGVTVAIPAAGPAIALAVGGEVAIAGGPRIGGGEALFIDAESRLQLSGHGSLFVASSGSAAPLS
jgi:mannose-6-phosphate isomerase